MPPSATVTLESQALATLRHIRASMDAASSVSVPGAAGLAVGVVGLGAATLSGSTLLHAYWLEVWVMAAAAGALSGAYFVAQRAAGRRPFTLLGSPVRKVFWSLAPCLLAGAVLTVVLVHSGNLHAIAGTWLLLYGCALIYMSTVTSTAIAVLGACFVALALAAFLLPGGEQIRTAVLGLGFGELHVLYGVFERRTAGGLPGLEGG